MIISIAYIYEHMFEMVGESKWYGKNGVISQIHSILKLQRGAYKLVKSVIYNFNKCLEDGVDYTGERVYSKMRDNLHILPSDSYEFSIISDAMEDGHGLRAATQLVNEYR